MSATSLLLLTGGVAIADLAYLVRMMVRGRHPHRPPKDVAGTWSVNGLPNRPYVYD